VRLDQDQQLAFERIDLTAQHSQRRDLLARDADAGTAADPTQPSVDPLKLAESGQRAALE
jgi:hypothetical protein